MNKFHLKKIFSFLSITSLIVSLIATPIEVIYADSNISIENLEENSTDVGFDLESNSDDTDYETITSQPETEIDITQNEHLDLKESMSKETKSTTSLDAITIYDYEEADPQREYLLFSYTPSNSGLSMGLMELQLHDVPTYLMLTTAVLVADNDKVTVNFQSEGDGLFRFQHSNFSYTVIEIYGYLNSEKYEPYINDENILSDDTMHLIIASTFVPNPESLELRPSSFKLHEVSIGHTLTSGEVLAPTTSLYGLLGEPVDILPIKLESWRYVGLLGNPIFERMPTEISLIYEEDIIWPEDSLLITTEKSKFDLMLLDNTDLIFRLHEGTLSDELGVELSFSIYSELNDQQIINNAVPITQTQFESGDLVHNVLGYTNKVKTGDILHISHSDKLNNGIMEIINGVLLEPAALYEERNSYFEITDQGFKRLYFNEALMRTHNIPLNTSTGILDLQIDNFVVYLPNTTRILGWSEYPDTNSIGQSEGKIRVQEPLINGQQIYYDYLLEANILPSDEVLLIESKTSSILVGSDFNELDITQLIDRVILDNNQVIYDVEVLSKNNIDFEIAGSSQRIILTVSSGTLSETVIVPINILYGSSLVISGSWTNTSRDFRSVQGYTIHPDLSIRYTPIRKAESYNLPALPQVQTDIYSTFYYKQNSGSISLDEISSEFVFEAFGNETPQTTKERFYSKTNQTGRIQAIEGDIVKVSHAFFSNQEFESSILTNRQWIALSKNEILVDPTPNESTEVYLGVKTDGFKILELNSVQPKSGVIQQYTTINNLDQLADTFITNRENIHSVEFLKYPDTSNIGDTIGTLRVTEHIVNDRYAYKDYDVTFQIEQPASISPLDPLNPEIEVEPDNKPELPEDQGLLSLDFISQFNFGSQAISVQDQVYYAQPQRLLNEDGTVNEEERPNYVQISDRRSDNERGGWQLAVTQNTPFTGLEGQELTGAQLQLMNQQLVTAQGGEAPSLQVINPLTLVPGNKRTLIRAEGTEGTGTWIYRFGDVETAAESVILEVPKGANPEATTYRTTLTWELSAVPEN